MRPCDLEKNREILFHAVPAGQAERARVILVGLEGLAVTVGADTCRLQVRYHICEYTLEGLEIPAGLHGGLRASSAWRLRRNAGRVAEL